MILLNLFNKLPLWKKAKKEIRAQTMRLVSFGEAQLEPEVVNTHHMFDFKEHFDSFLW